nr:MAG TPA: hypothetical protein [Bacteriophage sp.]
MKLQLNFHYLQNYLKFQNYKYILFYQQKIKFLKKMVLFFH